MDKYGFQDRFEDLSDMFGVEGKRRLAVVMRRLPCRTLYAMGSLLEQLEQTEQNIQGIEARTRRFSSYAPVLMCLFLRSSTYF